METVTNQAFLTFEYGSSKGFACSNVAMATVKEPVTITKLSLNETYSTNETLFYILSITNSGNCELQDVEIVDNLGTYQLGFNSVTPLTFVAPAQLYIDGIFESEIIPGEFQNSIQFRIPSIKSMSNAMILYKVIVNNTAPLILGSKITNVVTYAGGGDARNSVTAQNTIEVSQKAEIRVVKTMNPSILQNGDKILYTFSIYNYGNTEAKNVILTDTFKPAPSDLKVTVDGEAIEDSNYTYVGDTLTFPSSNTVFPVKIPAAMFSQDEITGIVTTNPGIMTISVTGTLV